jgi:hypothetical protein
VLVPGVSPERCCGVIESVSGTPEGLVRVMLLAVPYGVKTSVTVLLCPGAMLVGLAVSVALGG